MNRPINRNRQDSTESNYTLQSCTVTYSCQLQYKIVNEIFHSMNSFYQWLNLVSFLLSKNDVSQNKSS
jgi:hypothetical protein